MVFNFIRKENMIICVLPKEVYMINMIIKDAFKKSLTNVTLRSDLPPYCNEKLNVLINGPLFEKSELYP